MMGGRKGKVSRRQMSSSSQEPASALCPLRILHTKGQKVGHNVYMCVRVGVGLKEQGAKAGKPEWSLSYWSATEGSAAETGLA